MAVSALTPYIESHEASAGVSHDRGLLLIGIFKLGKAVFFVAVALGALHFIHHDLGQTLDRIASFCRLDSENRFVALVLGQADTVTHHRIRIFSMFSGSYAFLCSVEGMGLILHKAWAEYFTLWLSTAFVPWELWELVKHANGVRVSVLVMNLVIIAYLLWLLQRKRRPDSVAR